MEQRFRRLSPKNNENVIPPQAGIQKKSRNIDSCFRRNDGFLKFFLLCLFCLFIFFPPVVFAQQVEGDKAKAFYRESVKLFEDGNIDRAMDVVKEAIKADPNYPDAHDHLGYILLKKGQLDDAISAFNSALKINPMMRTSKTGIGLALLKKGDLKGAEAILKDALILNPYPSMTHYALGLVYEKLNDYEKAIVHFKEGIKTHKVRVGKE
ncbi:MAG: tetratricopeptide repeat protein [Nitrospirae bacterium]|nr:tetratricopeptide repeat protein [Nitrospirota bacterium]